MRTIVIVDYDAVPEIPSGIKRFAESHSQKFIFAVSFIMRAQCNKPDSFISAIFTIQTKNNLIVTLFSTWKTLKVYTFLKIYYFLYFKYQIYILVKSFPLC